MTAGDEVYESAEVVAVIVTYSPDPARLELVLQSLIPQVEAVIVVDNGQGAELAGICWSPRLQLIDMKGNAGVAAALNAGMRQAFAQGAKHVLLLDHDSVPQADMVETLRRSFADLERSGQRVAAVGANYKDSRRPAISPFIRVTGFRLERLDHLVPKAVWLVSYLISSGSLISARAFDEVGPMDDRLFIDYIDIEWGLRAGQRGWACFGVCDATLDHFLGDEPVHIFGTAYPARSPLRHYYMVRNAVWLLMRTSLPIGWKCVEAWRLLRRTVAYALFARGRLRHIASMLAGLADGLRGRMGGREDATSAAADRRLAPR